MILAYILAFTVGMKQTAEAINQAETAAELDELIQQQTTKQKTKE